MSKLKGIFEVIKGLDKEVLLRLSGDWNLLSDADKAIVDDINSLSVSELNTLTNDLCSHWSIDINSLSVGTAGTADDSGEDAGPVLIHLILKSVDPEKKVKSILALKKIMDTFHKDDGLAAMTLADIKGIVDGLSERPFEVQVNFTKGDERSVNAIKSFTDAGFVVDIKKV